MHREGHIGLALIGYTPLGFLGYAAGFQDVALAGGAVTLALAMAPDMDSASVTAPPARATS
jgi:inner membrane protein